MLMGMVTRMAEPATVRAASMAVRTILFVVFFFSMEMSPFFLVAPILSYFWL